MIDKKSRVLVGILIVFMVTSAALIMTSQSSSILTWVKVDFSAKSQPKYSIEHLEYSTIDRLGTWAVGLAALSSSSHLLGVGPDASVEALTDVTSCRENQSLLIVWDLAEARGLPGPLLRAPSAVKHDEVSNESRQSAGEVLEMVPPFRKEDRRPTFFDGPDHVIQNQFVPALVRR